MFSETLITFTSTPLLFLELIDCTKSSSTNVLIFSKAFTTISSSPCWLILRAPDESKKFLISLDSFTSILSPLNLNTPFPSSLREREMLFLPIFLEIVPVPNSKFSVTAINVRYNAPIVAGSILVITLFSLREYTAPER